MRFPPPLPSPPRCRTSTAIPHCKCSLPDLNRDRLRPVFAAGPQLRCAAPSVRCWTSTKVNRMSEDMSERLSARMFERMSDRMPGDMPEYMSERTSERMSDRMPRDMPERM